MDDHGRVIAYCRLCFISFVYFPPIAYALSHLYTFLFFHSCHAHGSIIATRPLLILLGRSFDGLHVIERSLQICIASVPTR